MDCAGVEAARLDAAGQGEPDEAASPPAAAREHIASCPPCLEVDQAFARLDALLRSEPAPEAPADFARDVLVAVAARRARDLVWARGQALVLLLAAALLALSLGVLLGGWSSPVTWGAGLSSAWDEVVVARVEVLGATGDRLLSSIASALGGASFPGSLPASPFVLLVVFVPVLVALDWTLCRPGRLAASWRST